ncbi:MAG: 1-acyl-sn-glycerol-3-phosphate acyltransferase [Clostridioides sp.]|jgi:1-acyl-sn-glycerol-3-phosphate acyltransferase|nr:1-acyl-sn-glycerol-3-phosphate acyltransferase [Clostridioides sp.]
MNLYKFLVRFCRVFCIVFYRVKVVGAENIPDEGNIVVAANHKSNLDPVFVATSMLNRQISAIAKKELFTVPILGSLLKKINMIPIDRENPAVSTIKQILKTVKEGYVLGIFPEGHRYKGDQFGDAEAGLGLFAVKTKSQVIPTSIVSNYRIFGKTTVYFGEPIDLSENFGKKMTNDEYKKISQDILEVIKTNYYELKK